MKKLFRSVAILTAITAIGLSACKDPETVTPTESNPPTLTINGSLEAKNTISVSADSVSMYIVASAATDRTLKKMIITRGIPQQSTVTLLNKTNYTVKDLAFGFIDTITSGTNQFGLTDGDEITYTVTVEDDKGKTQTAIMKVSVATLAVSPQLFIGGPSCTINDFRFFGVEDNFQRYRAGSDSTKTFLARKSPGKVDFLFFWNAAGSVQNAIYSPDYNFGAGIGWNAETDTWSIKNKTLLKLTPDITSSAFDALIGANFKTELDLIDFTSGTSDKLTNLNKDNVFAYKKWNGKRGFIKVGSGSTSASGQILLLIKAEL